MFFKRLNNKYIVELLDLDIFKQPAEINTESTVTLSKTESVDGLAVRFYGRGREGDFYKISYKNADRLLAWDLDNTNINVLDIPKGSAY